MVLSIALLAIFGRWAVRKGDRALIDLELFKRKTFAAATVTQFMSNGISFAGQMLIPFYLIRACDRSPAATGLLLAPLGAGMILLLSVDGSAAVYLACESWIGRRRARVHSFRAGNGAERGGDSFDLRGIRFSKEA